MTAVMKIAKAAFQVLCAVLFTLLVLACSDADRGLTAEGLWNGILSAATEHTEWLMWGAIAALQLVLMRWLGGLWNVVFSLLSVLLMAELIMLAGNLQAAITTPLFNELSAAGAGDIVSRYPVAYWLIPMLWFISCLCAPNQVRVFITAVVCYLLWLFLSWLVTLGVNTWLGMGEPAPAQLASLFSASPWLTAAIPGCFLLIYAELMAIFEACLGSRRKS